MPGLSSLALKIAGVPSLSGSDVKSLNSLSPQRRMFAKGTIVCSAGAIQQNVFLICSGWAASYRLLSDGGRQVAAVLLPGDFSGLGAEIMPLADRTLEAATNLTALVFG